MINDATSAFDLKGRTDASLVGTFAGAGDVFSMWTTQDGASPDHKAKEADADKYDQQVRGNIVWRALKKGSYPLRLPGHLLAQAREVAAASGSSLNQFFLAATAEKVGELKGSLRARAAGVDLTQARTVLDRVPDAPLESGDERAG